MKRLFRALSITCLSLLMGLMMVVPASAEEQTLPTEIIQISDNEILEIYELNSDEFNSLELEMFGNNIDFQKNRQKRALGDFPERKSVSYSSFQVGDVASATAAIGTIMGFGFAPQITIAGLALKMMGYGTVYTKRTYTQRRTNRVLYVRNEIEFYSNAARTKKITSWAVNREYSDNGLD